MGIRKYLMNPHQYLMITALFLSMMLFSISPVSHAANGEEDVMEQLNAIHVSLTQEDKAKEKIYYHK